MTRKRQRKRDRPSEFILTEKVKVSEEFLSVSAAVTPEP